MWKRVWVLGLVLGSMGCEPAGNDGTSRRDGAVGSEDARVPPSGDDSGPAPLPDGATPTLSLTLDVADGDCADLARTDRAGHAVRFEARGVPGRSIELWADKPACGVEPFRYQTLTLDDAGVATFDIDHVGSDTCADTLLGQWRVWLVDGAEATERQDLAFSSAACAEAASCASVRGFCPAEPPPVDEPLIPRDQLFVLSPEERAVFTPPDPSWLEWGGNYEDFPLRALWEAFDEGRGPVPMVAGGGSARWFDEDGGGSHNHAILWMGDSVLGHAFDGDVEQYEIAAQRCLRLFELESIQGHMRHEAIGGYTGFWQGGIAAMALGAFYAPEGSTSGPALLAAARRWWDEHVGALRALSMPDGQVGLVGARFAGAPGDTDSWTSLGAALTLQLIDPRPHGQLHPTIAALVSADGQPGRGTGGVPVKWHRPRAVAQMWVVLRAIQSGAIRNPPPGQPGPARIAQDIYRWNEGARVHIALPASKGLRPARWSVSWAPGTVIRVEVGDPAGTDPTGRAAHPPPTPLNIPASAALVVGDGIPE